MVDVSLLGAIEDYRHGHFADARRKLVRLDGIEARLCFLALHLRLRDSAQLAEAVEAARELQSSPLMTAEDEIQLRIYLSFILARTGDLEGAAIAIRESMAILQRIPSPLSTLDAELTLANALVLFMQGRILASERQAWNAVYANLELGYRPEPLRLPLAPIEVTKARALTLIGVIRGTQERFHEQYRFLREAMVMLRQSPTLDVSATAVIHANRSFHARDLGMLGDIVELELVEHESWPADLAELRLEVTRSLSYLYALSGREELAIRGFASAADFAPTEANRLLLLSDEAYIARQLTSPRLRRTELLQACHLADRIEWGSVDAEQYALSAFAQELAFVDSGRALSYMNRHSKLRVGVNPMAVSDRRDVADAKYSEGTVASANGHRERAIDAFAKAFEIWREIGFRWRAITAAIELAELTGSSGMIGYVSREVSQYPNSWLARRTTMLGRRAS